MGGGDLRKTVNPSCFSKISYGHADMRFCLPLSVVYALSVYVRCNCMCVSACVSVCE